MKPTLLILLLTLTIEFYGQTDSIYQEPDSISYFQESAKLEKTETIVKGITLSIGFLSSITNYASATELETGHPFVLIGAMCLFIIESAYFYHLDNKLLKKYNLK